MEGNIKVECMLLGRKVLDTYHFNKLLSLAHRGGGGGKRILSCDAVYFKAKFKGLARARNPSSRNSINTSQYH